MTVCFTVHKVFSENESSLKGKNLHQREVNYFLLGQSFFRCLAKQF